MRRVWASALGISLSLGVASALAQDNSWNTTPRAQSPSQGPAVTLGRPVPAATLGRPVERTDSPAVRPAGFQNSTGWKLDPVPAPHDTAPLLAPIGAPPVADAGAAGKPMPNADGAFTPLPALTPPLPAPGRMMANVGGGLVNGWGYGPATSLFAPILPYDGGPNHFYGSAEFLLWWVRDARVPALAIATPVVPNNTVPRPQPETVLFGGDVNGIYPTNRYGARFNFGWWFNPNQCRGLDFSFMVLGTAFTDFTASSDQFPNISRPFFNLNRNEPFTEIVAGTGVATGSIRITGESSLWGSEINYRRGLLRACDGFGRLDAIAGFRFLHLNENLQITETSMTVANPIPGVTPASGTAFDRFATINDFYGGQLGLVFNRQWGRWSVDATAKVALGTTHSQVSIAGGQNLFINGRPTGAIGDLLALNSNMGTYNTNAFSVVPEVGINLGYQIMPRMKAIVGYSFLYWSNVSRPGNQIDTGIDVTRIPNFNAVDANGNPITTPVANRPAANLPRTDFWAQGINFGLQFKW